MKYLCINDNDYGGYFTEGITYTLVTPATQEDGTVELISNSGKLAWILLSELKEDFIPVDIDPSQAEANYAFHHPQASF